MDWLLAVPSTNDKMPRCDHTTIMQGGDTTVEYNGTIRYNHNALFDAPLLL